MYQLLTSLLNVRPQEIWLVKKLFFIQFFLVLAGAFLFITANTIFISTHPVADLPKAYILTAIFLVIANYGYQKLDKSVDVKVLSFTIVTISIAVLTLQWALMQYFDNTVMPYVLLVAYNVVYMLVGYLFWTLAALLFNTKDSKRIFTLISAGDLPAKLVAYLSITYIAYAIGMENMLLVSLAALIVAGILVYRLFNNKNIDILEFEHEQVHYFKKHTFVARVSRLFRIFGSELTVSLSGVAFISFLVYVFVDFTFLTEVKPTFKTDLELSQFFGIFLAIGRVGGVLIKLVFSSRMINRIGILKSLLFLPLSLLLFCIGIFIVKAVQPDLINFLYVFGFMFLLIEIGKAVIQEPMFFVLFQPLKLDLRMKGHVIAKGYMYPLALLGAGLILVNYLENHKDVSFQITTGVLALCIAIWIVLIFTVKRSYVRTLQEAIRSGYFRGNELFLEGDDTTQQILVQKTESRKPAEVIYALELLQRAQYPQMNQVIQRMLGRKESVIVDYALDWILENSGAEMIGALEMLSDSHPSEEIRAKCLYCIGTIAPERLEQMKDFIFSQHPSICIAAVTVFLQSNNPQYYKKALDRLYHLATESVEEKKMAAEIIGRCKRIELSPLLIQMLHDSELAVRQAAIHWAGEVPSRELIAPLVELLRQKPTRKHARQALIRLQLVAIEEMIALKLPQNDPVIPELARVAGAVVHERSASFLLQCIQSHDQHRNEVIYALWQLAYAAEGPYEKTLHQVARQLLDEAASVADQLVATGSDSNSPHLKKALYYELRNLTDTILRLLSILYSREKLNQVILALDLKESFKTSNSLELLHVTLPSGIYSEVERLLDVVEMNYSLADKKTRYKTVVDVLEGIIMHAPRVYNRWTNAQAIYQSGEKKLRHIIHALKHSRREDKEPIVQETKMFVISQNT